MFSTVRGALSSSAFMLTVIKVAHTIVWGFFVTCIVAVWVFALKGEYFHAALAIGIVMIEVLVLVLNGLHCPLTSIAARYTGDRHANFDICLPEWLAKHTKTTFGGLYAGGIILTLARWACTSP